MPSNFAISAALAAFVCFTPVFSGTSLSAINPADPGLPPADAYGQTAIPNNGASAMCVECHTENPMAGKGTHFVMNRLTGVLRRTNSGGGWEEGAWGVRDNGQFFKLSPWKVELGGSGGSSRYGDVDNWVTVVFSGGDPPVGCESARHETSPEKMTRMELICESCHSIAVNVEGRYNLLSKVINSTIVDNMLDGPVADLCVGCHGFLYHDDAGVANAANANWSDLRNISDVGGVRRANNEAHYINGKKHKRNHHVMTGDNINPTLVEAGLTIRDVNVLATSMISTPISTNSTKGSMPIRTPPLLPIVLSQSAAHLNCLTCHAPAHGGEPSMGAAILKGVNLRGRDAGFFIDRISDGKPWGRFNDNAFCGACHE